MFYVKIGQELASEIDSNVNPLSYVNPVANSIVIPSVSQYEVRQVIVSLKSSSPGWDDFPAFLGKQCIDCYISPLLFIINICLQEGVFPDKLKHARVLPIHKSGDKKNINNYRPISILPFFSKVFEIIMDNYIIDCMDQHEIILKYRFGFRQKHSTQHAAC